MNILFRYVFREFCIPLGYCLTGFVSIYILFELFGSFSRLIDAKPAFDKVVLYFSGYLAPYFEWLAPACMMLATLYTMWSFCRHSELIAMRASGVGFITIVKPILLAAIGMAAFVFWVNEWFVPIHSQWAKQYRTAKFHETAMATTANIVYRNVRDSRTWNIGKTDNADASQIRDVIISEERSDGGRSRVVKADLAQYMDGGWWLTDPTVVYFDATGMETSSPTPELEKLSFRCFPEFTENPTDFMLQNRDEGYYSIADRRRFLFTHPNMSADSRRRISYDMWAQMASPLACIVITLFAIPAGIATGRQSVFRGILTALGMFFAFYALTICCMIAARTGFLPAIPAAFLPDVVFIVIGAVMFRRQR